MEQLHLQGGMTIHCEQDLGWLDRETIHVI